MTAGSGVAGCMRRVWHMHVREPACACKEPEFGVAAEPPDTETPAETSCECVGAGAICDRPLNGEANSVDIIILILNS